MRERQVPPEIRHFPHRPSSHTRTDSQTLILPYRSSTVQPELATGCVLVRVCIDLLTAVVIPCPLSARTPQKAQVTSYPMTFVCPGFGVRDDSLTPLRLHHNRRGFSRMRSGKPTFRRQTHNSIAHRSRSAGLAP